MVYTLYEYIIICLNESFKYYIPRNKTIDTYIPNKLTPYY